MLDSFYHMTQKYYEISVLLDYAKILPYICDIVVAIITWASSRENLFS